jgi:acetamidase/formamidase
MIVSLYVAMTSVKAETIRFKPTVGYDTFAVREPVLRIKPGDVVESNSLPSRSYFGDNSPGPNIDGSTGDGATGPFYVEGATTNDTLVITILKIRPSIDSGRSGTSPTFAVLTPTTNTPMLSDPAPEIRFMWKIDREHMKATLDLPKSKAKRIEVDLIPMLGRMAVAPDGSQAISGAWPGPFGGNMDSSDAREGATVYLPIFHDGAYFYFGDAHGLQGDGELTGSGIETAVDVTLKFDLIKNQKIEWPRMENQDFIMVAGSARPLEDAFRIANVEMIKWLEHDYGFDRWEALQVLSQVAVSRIANVVDPNYTVMAKFPKQYLPKR